MDKYTSIKLSERYRDFELSSKSKLRRKYKNFSKELNIEYRTVKEELSKKIDKALKVKLPTINSKLYNMDIQTEQLNTNLEKTIINSETDYGIFHIGKLFEIFGFNGSQEKIIIDGNRLFNDIKQNINKRLEIIFSQEEDSHKNKIEKFVEQYFDLYRDFEDKKSIEIEELKDNYEEAQKNDYANKESHKKLEDIVGGLNG